MSRTSSSPGGSPRGRQHRASHPASLAPLLRERVARLARPGWSRTLHARRAVAALLVMLAGVLAVRGDPAAATTDVVVAAHDLRPGQVLAEQDLSLVRRPVTGVPEGVVHTLAEVTGRTVAGAVRAGEPFTDVRVVGPSLAAAATGSSDSTAVPVRLADADVAELLRPGDEVDVLVVGEDVGEVRVLASGGTVLAVQPGDEQRSGDGRLVVLGLPARDAAAVAAASLEQPVAVTFR